ncbi:alpha-ketoacid dehydrogenase subunit beta [Brevibacillus laterosporus]|uniref:Alpha-ketoacid dehydrogenase subunit beta n=1 Tax=Brevibacillus laterosporus TaxID=1465 RepID=A0AAP8QFF2_BRELA|nr:alpha-ketoacid dehydrogenase subunit beta [Brevibacillus laterosporus]MED1666318.1 alpha-ketoacid dehydrogenase subunit beta [Brevibacillus laterosporus]MED1670641.1 alpha-ketoacid dehydrogenase subunit beta [Brevibacillus laterosporus]MED1716652.1 alpha-ketoacid dehydrogenase subunit beta [Brevibacillus laterosporus]PPA89447.1 alpha-ketoacid dehydrogenase subunit beta [Brevibacillus laterosporus]PPB10492.1 alpha-ketoacid dehydrogenase subunit beta [Brevibacillus laterosporus]
MREITYLEAVREAMSQEMLVNPDVFLMGEDIGVYGGAFGVSRGMIEEFGPERIRNTPISEAAIAGAAVGAAMTGMRPIMELQFSDFVTIAMDQLVNQAAKNRYMFGGKGKVPMVVRTPSGSGTGAAAQHTQSLEAWMAHIPGLKVVQPSTAYDVKGLLKAAIDDNNPVIFYEHKLLYKISGDVPEESYSIPLGVADVKREGTDVTIVATAIMVHKALEAAAELEKEGISVEVIDPRTLVPLDTDTIIRSVKKTGKLIVVHEAVKFGGFGGEIASMIAESEAFDYLDAPIRRLGGKWIPMPYNPILEKAAIPQVPDIIQAVKDTVAHR